MTKSWAWGAATVFAVHVLWFALILTQAHADWVMGGIIVMLFVTMNIAGLGAFITSYRAPRRRFVLGLTMAPLTALLSTGLNLLLEVTGTHVNFAGGRGSLGLFAVSLAYGIFVSAVGGAIGTGLAHRHARLATPAPVTAEPTAPEPAVQPNATAESKPAAPPSHI